MTGLRVTPCPVDFVTSSFGSPEKRWPEWSAMRLTLPVEDVPEIVEEVGGSSVGDYVPRWMFKSRTEEPPWDDSTGQEMDGARHLGIAGRGRLLVERLGGVTR